jgi:hypothetical protein
MSRYYVVKFKRESEYIVETVVEADSEEDAIQKAQSGDWIEEEEVHQSILNESGFKAEIIDY